MKSGRAGSCINSSSLTLARFGRVLKYILSIYRQIAGYCSWIQSNWFKFCYFDWKAMIYKVLKPYYNKINPLLDLLLPFVISNILSTIISNISSSSVKCYEWSVLHYLWYWWQKAALVDVLLVACWLKKTGYLNCSISLLQSLVRLSFTIS